MSEEVSAEVSEPEPDQSTEPRGIRRFALRHPRLMVWLIAVLIFGMWGSWAGPGWNPQPMRSLIVPESADTSIATRNETPELGDYEVQSEVITIELRDGTEIPATLRTPVGTDGLAPGMVFVHGTGPIPTRTLIGRPMRSLRWRDHIGTGQTDGQLHHYTP